MTQELVVTGVDGFVGRHVARLAAESGITVTGISRSERPAPSLAPHLGSYISADLRRAWPTGAPVDAPIVHLAGLAAVGPSFSAPQKYIDANSAMVTHMCEALVRGDSGARVVAISTGAVYANVDGHSTHDESAPVAFTSPYVVSKILVENQIAYYRGRGLAAVTARPFNHIGPGQSTGFLVPDLITQLSASDFDDVLSVGNLASRRDYTDVRDVARAYLALATSEHLSSGLYNVSSGVSRSGAEILALICESLNRPVPRLRVDTARLRPNDPASIAGDASRIRSEVDWRPEITLEQTIRDVVDGSVGA